MLGSIILLLLNITFGLLTLLLLARFFMQWQRVPFYNQIGQFVLKATDWIVVPFRRFVPGFYGMDMASLLPAFLLQMAHASLELGIRSIGFGGGVAGIVLGLPGVAVVDLLRLVVYLLFAIILVAALISWISPNAPAAPVFRMLAEPFLRPFRRVIPTVANIDLSPLAVLVLLQIALIVLTGLRNNFVMMVAGAVGA